MGEIYINAFSLQVNPVQKRVLIPNHLGIAEALMHSVSFRIFFPFFPFFCGKARIDVSIQTATIRFLSHAHDRYYHECFLWLHAFLFSRKFNVSVKLINITIKTR